MPTDTERRLEAIENLLLFGGGVAAGTASGRQLAAAAARRLPAAGLSLARRHPAATVAVLAYVAYKQGLTVETVTDLIQEEIDANPQFFIQEQVKQQIRESFPDILSAVGETVPARPTKLQKALIKGLGIRDRPTKLGGIFTPSKKRKVSKANRAVKQAMGWLKAGTKAATGAMPGTLPKGAFRTAVKAAGLANPNSKSKPGKGKSLINKIARRLKKWW